jgi:hypothetical protein
MRQRQSYESFAGGFQGTARDEVEIVSVDPMANGLYDVNIRLTAHQADGSVKRFSGSYFVGQEGGSWKLLDARIEAR